MVDDLPTLPGSLIWDRGRSEVRLVSSPFSSFPPFTIIRDIRRLLSSPAHLNAVRYAAVCCARASERSEPETAMQRSTLGKVAEPVTHAAGPMLPLHADAVAPGYEEVDKMQPAGAVAAFAVLLSRLPALETLEIRTFDRAEDEEDDEQTASIALGDPVISLLCRQMLSAGNAAFAHVKTARIVVPYPDEDPAAEFGFYVSADTVLPLFYLPQVRNLEMHRVEDGGRLVSWPAGGRPVSATQLKELVMSKAQLTEASVDQLVRACPDLEVLRWEHVIDAEYARSWLDLDALRTSLETLKHSLEELSFSVILWTSTAIDCGEKGPWGIRGTLASLRGFAQLKRVTISLPVLLGWRTDNSARLADVLPASIECITVTNEMFFWWHSRWDDIKWEADDPSVPRWHTLEAKITEYLEARPSSLRQLKVEVWTAGETSRAEELRDRLTAVGAATGVHVTVELRS
ncbi:hypothetical protein COL26b_013267 [Colletotrichum chrysophilum]|uniref:uncharacterized protein n=1 Tax=Colletotrichum chrysophilum TaxID=1836956 RepID=UPI00230118A9|nr:uncharacterized protein COL26b_013267 [Colletotrichum chrysophilum]KAJ0302665.1 hypothetical protein Brms1b_011970 [Colletotrichum noveboracense]KAJ0362585.1 hypothetical protein COL26b_013267 [Colletotrichum chrysophilum]